MSQGTTTLICECNSWKPCGKNVQLSLQEAQDILQKELVVIVDGCPNGPDSTDQLIEKRDGYTLYQEQEARACTADTVAVRSIPSRTVPKPGADQ